MNDKLRQELIDVLQSVHPRDQLDVLQFAYVLKLSRRADLRPPTAQQWSRLSQWQKLYCLWIASPRVAIAFGWRYLLSMQWLNS